MTRIARMVGWTLIGLLCVAAALWLVAVVWRTLAYYAGGTLSASRMTSASVWLTTHAWLGLVLAVGLYVLVILARQIEVTPHLNLADRVAEILNTEYLLGNCTPRIAGDTIYLLLPLKLKRGGREALVQLTCPRYDASCWSRYRYVSDTAEEFVWEQRFQLSGKTDADASMIAAAIMEELSRDQEFWQPQEMGWRHWRCLAAARLPGVHASRRGVVLGRLGPGGADQVVVRFDGEDRNTTVGGEALILSAPTSHIE